MNEHIKDYIVKVTFMWLLVGAAFTIPASCCKAVRAFHEQVIKKNSPELTVIAK